MPAAKIKIREILTWPAAKIKIREILTWQKTKIIYTKPFPYQVLRYYLLKAA